VAGGKEDQQDRPGRPGHRSRAAGGRDDFTLFITAGDLPDAYKLTSAAFQQAHTQAQLAALFAPPAGAKWAIFAPDMATYTVSGTTATYSGAFEYLDATGALKGAPYTFSFAQNGAAWQVDGVTKGS